MPKNVIPICYTALACTYASSYQDKKITEHLDNGGRKANWLKTLGISLIGGVLTLLVVLLISYI
jgi:hypothetical protein